MHILVQAKSALAQQRFQKSTSFPLFFFMPCACVAAWALGRRGGEADAAALLAACPPAENFLSNGCTSDVA
ncbi:hypothetical protein OM952_15335 [Xanthomonas phaseoli pv. phaseoli]|uniref:hypothetical protein n=1 Tax=Xanthomonas phaseoli TaxID=1985254 RepID=UPI002226E990|nr:hypothetical protein [Xanthomonas phaseoli]UZB11194.1 hypothetical protein OM952_15335 [Xanthomonas phaseoli pv. phaseoli]